MAAVLVGSVTQDGATYNIYAEEIAGSTTFTITLVSGNGDLRGLFFDYADSNQSLGLNADGLVTASYFGDGGDGQDPPPPPPANTGDDIDTLGTGNTVNGTGFVFDAALAFGTAGGAVDVDTVTFTVNGLTFDDIDGQTFAIRSQATGATEEGSIKAVGVFDIPDDPPPEVCLDGFSHGYWKTHTDLWDGAGESTHLAGDSFEATFGIGAHGSWINPGSGKVKPVNLGGDVTLAQALGLQGGGENALAREAVGALENATAGDLISGSQYAFTEAQIILAVQCAFGYHDGNASNDGVYNATLGNQLQVVLEHWNTIHDDTTTLDGTPAWDASHGWCVDQGSSQDPTATSLIGLLGWHPTATVS